MRIIGTLVTKDYKKLLRECSFIDTWFLNIKNLSYSHFNNFSCEEIDEIIKNENKCFILNLEKLYSEEELDNVKQIIQKYKINKNIAFSYSDMGVYQLLIDENVSRTIYHSSTMITNIFDLKIVLSENEDIIMGKEISFDELLEIDQKLPKKISIDAFGKFPIFYSKRKLLSTYFKYRQYDYSPNDLDYALVEEFRSDEYPITEQNETIVYEPFFYVLGTELKSFQNIENIVIYPQFLDLDDYIRIINLYYDFINNQIEKLEYSNFEDNLKIPYYKGKLTEKTILKKGDK